MILQAASTTKKLIVLLAVVTLSLVSWSQPAVAQPRVDFSLGFDGVHEPGRDMLVQVEVEADRLISGHLQISDRNLEHTIIVPVQVAGGSTKRFVAVVPAMPGFQAVTVELVEGNTVTNAQRNGTSSPQGEVLVGVLPSRSATMPDRAALSVNVGSARLHPIDETILNAGSGAIDSLGAIVVDTSDLASISESARGAIVDWVTRGGNLIVDEAPGPVPGFDVSSDTSPVQFGVGSIVATNGVIGAGTWDGVVAPSPQGFSDQTPFGREITGEGFFGWDPIANSLASQAGLDLPPARAVLVVMGLYILIAGPLSFLVLRRLRRARLLWVVLPALAALFTVGVWTAGTAVRADTRDVHGTVIAVRNDQAMTTSTVLRSSRNGGQVGLDMPPGWRATPTTDGRFGNDGIGQVTLRQSGSAVRVETDLDAGAFAAFGAQGSSPTFNQALTATAQSSPDSVVTGTVTNNLTVDLSEVGVFVGLAGVNIGTIPAGATVDFTIDEEERSGRFGPPVEFRVWDERGNFNQFGPGGRNEESVINLSLWNQYLESQNGNGRQLGEVVVAGWTSELDAPIGNGVSSGHTLVVATADVEAPAGLLTDVSSRRTLLEVNDVDFMVDGRNPNVESMWRFDLPQGVELDSVGLGLPSLITKIAIWVDGAWVEIDDVDEGVYSLPPDAVGDDGSVFVRPGVRIEGERFLGREFSIRTVTNRAELNQTLVTAAAEATR